MSFNPENSAIFSLDNLRALANVNTGRRRLASLGPGDATSFINLSALNRLDSDPAALHAPGVLIAPTRQVANRWLFPALLSLGVLLLLFSGLAMAVVIKKQRARQMPQAPTVAVDATAQPTQQPTPPTATALTPAPVQQRAMQVGEPAAAPQKQQPASATPRQELAERKTSHQIAKAKRIRRARRLARQRRQRRQRKLRRSQRRSGTRVAARSARKIGKKGQELDALLLGF